MQRFARYTFRPSNRNSYFQMLVILKILFYPRNYCPWVHEKSSQKTEEQAHARRYPKHFKLRNRSSEINTEASRVLKTLITLNVDWDRFRNHSYLHRVVGILLTEQRSANDRIDFSVLHDSAVFQLHRRAELFSYSRWIFPSLLITGKFSSAW